MSRDNVHTHVNLVQPRIGRHLKLEQIDADERGVPELNLNSDPLFQEIQFRRGIFRFIEHRWLVLPSLGDQGLLEYFIEVRPGQGGNVNARLKKDIFYFLL
jgi:hypothetical protein